MIERAKQLLQTEIQALLNLPLNEDLEICVKMFKNCKGKIIFLGMGKAGIVARKIAATLSSTGTPSIFVHPGEAAHGDLGIITNDDVIVAFTNSGKTKEILLALKLCKNVFTCPIIGITCSKTAKISLYCDLILEIGKIKEICPFGLAPTSSTTTMMVLGDILAVLTMEEKGFTIEDYGLRHHGGYLGKIVREISEAKELDE